ncbi:Aste57867_17928 [Aphanomyces stellatus]|uniref:Aste57867_17928 protein n=1 Tax=Aphanomyces stellatus TaxID=120398 RepID=A0A485L8S5_9STRA|nr:hypothetical protein As57867_017866 [Aphanomyces stellatus]VFT94669.1 Aste57867_17928 [Aphanomyces stellatus]
MAPEMLLFQGYTSAVDVYSLGVVLSEVDTHHVPYADDATSQSDEAIARQVIHEGLRPSFRPDCPDWFQTLALECMAHDPLARPSITKVMFELDRHIRELE